MSKIFVTGGSGFIGSSVIRRLVLEGNEVTNYDINPPIGPNHALNVIGDIRNSELLVESMAENEVAYHIAATPYIPDGYSGPRDMVEVIINGTLNALLAAKESEVKHFIHFSSSEVYGSSIYVPMDEKHPTNPVSTYAVAKLAAERLVYTMGHEQNIPFTIIRQFNVIGERDTHHRIVPYIISELINGRTKIRIGNSGSCRDFTYVEDTADACYKVMNNQKAYGETINIGTGLSWRGFEIAKIVSEKLGIKPPIFEVDPRQVRPLDVNVLCADNSKAKRILGWEPKTDLFTALDKIIAWRKTHGPYSWEGYYDKKNLIRK